MKHLLTKLLISFGTVLIIVSVSLNDIHCQKVNDMLGWGIFSNNPIKDGNNHGIDLPDHADSICMNFYKDAPATCKNESGYIDFDNYFLELEKRGIDYLIANQTKIKFSVILYKMKYIEAKYEGKFKMVGKSNWWVPVVDLRNTLLTDDDCEQLYDNASSNLFNKMLSKDNVTGDHNYLSSIKSRLDNLSTIFDIELDYSSNSLDIIHEKFIYREVDVDPYELVDDFTAYLGEIMIYKFQGEWTMKVSRNRWTPYIKLNDGALFEISRIAGFCVESDGDPDLRFYFSSNFPEHLASVYFKNE